jgi:hypothetical protein
MRAPNIYASPLSAVVSAGTGLVRLKVKKLQCERKQEAQSPEADEKGIETIIVRAFLLPTGGDNRSKAPQASADGFVQLSLTRVSQDLILRCGIGQRATSERADNIG